MSEENWHKFALAEIDGALKRGKRLWESELETLSRIRPRIENGIGLTDKQEKDLLRIRAKATEPTRIKWR